VLKAIFLTVTNLVAWFYFIHGIVYVPDKFNVMWLTVQILWSVTSGIAALCIITSCPSPGQLVLKLWRATHVMVYFMIVIKVLISSNYLLILFFTGKGKEDFVDFYTFMFQLAAFLVALCIHGFSATCSILFALAAVCATYYTTVSCLTAGMERPQKLYPYPI
jgi:hypothetical protein